MLTLSDYLGLFVLLVLVLGIFTAPRVRRSGGVHRPRIFGKPTTPRPPPPPASPTRIPGASGALGTGARCEAVYGGARCILPSRHVRPCIPEEIQS